MPKTTKGDGMEQVARDWCHDYVEHECLEKAEASLTRLLRRMIKEASRKQKIRCFRVVNGLDPLLFSADWEDSADIAYSVRDGIAKAIINDKS